MAKSTTIQINQSIKENIKPYKQEINEIKTEKHPKKRAFC